MPAIRQLGRLERVTTDSLASVAAALPLPGGRVLVNDRIALRVLLFDSDTGASNGRRGHDECHCECVRQTSGRH